MNRRREYRHEASEAQRRRSRREGLVRPEGVASDAVVRVMRVPPEMAGCRIDRFVQGQLRGTSRTRSQEIIKRTAFSPDGHRLKKNRRLQAEELVVLWRAPWDEQEVPTELPSIYEDQDLFAISKPPLMVVHPTARHHRNTVAMLLAAQRPDEHLTLIHRLDRETSGVLLLARHRAADRAVKIQFEQRSSVLKRYLAICWGWPSWRRHTCELPLGPDPKSAYRVKMRASPEAHLPSATTFEVLERRQREGRRYALIRCTLHTGRQHQIRVHLASCGLPVVGDKLYGPDETVFARCADDELTDADLALMELDRHALHAADLTIDHPSTEERVCIEAPLPADMQGFWDALGPA